MFGHHALSCRVQGLMVVVYNPVGLRIWAPLVAAVGLFAACSSTQQAKGPGGDQPPVAPVTPGSPPADPAKAPIDLEVERSLHEQLAPVDPSWGWESEEDPALQRIESTRWVIAPNDGTLHYLRGHRGAAARPPAIG